MSAYYPSQAGYATTQQVPYGASYSQPYGMSAGYAPSGGVMYVPTYNSGYSHRHRRRRYNDYRMPQVVPSVAAPVMMAQTGYNGNAYPQYTLGQRFRRFFGLAPNNGVRYKNDRGTWGFMGYSRRQRYIDPRTGGEVDRRGRPVYRV